MVTCRYCKKEVEIPFSEPKKDRAGRISQKGVCPNCSKTNIKYTSKYPPVEPEITEPEGPGEPQEAYRDQAEEPPVEPEGRSDLPPGEPIEIHEEEEPEEIIEPENQELIVEGEEAETVVEDLAEKRLKQYQIGLMILTAVLIMSVIINLWLITRKQEV